VEGALITVTASAGVAHAGDVRKATALLAAADAAMYRAKRRGRGRVSIEA
jgi:GGDEF domain-containing protein